MQINAIAFDLEDIEQEKAIKRFIIYRTDKSVVEKAKMVNAAYHNFRVNCLRKAFIIHNAVMPIDVQYNIENQLIAREAIGKLQRGLNKEEYYQLINWFFNGSEKTLVYYRKIAAIREKCKRILNT